MHQRNERKQPVSAHRAASRPCSPSPGWDLQNATPRDDGWEATAPRIYIQDENLKAYDRPYQVETLVHELTHAAGAPLAGPFVPSWVHEGVADWVATGHRNHEPLAPRRPRHRLALASRCGTSSADGRATHRGAGARSPRQPRVNVLERILAKKILARIPAPTTPHLKCQVSVEHSKRRNGSDE